ncbi:MAG TPA: diacylglycerol kinase family protein [Tepidisphaeraceae bacterium]|jgi:diacylglycerol kinase family enzyme
MGEQKVVIFANPIAGRGKGRLLAGHLKQRFEKKGWDVQQIFDRPESVSQDTLTGAAAVVSIGGDGTLRSVVERVTDGGATEGPGILVVPMGTANLMGRHLGIGLSEQGLEDRAVEAIRAKRIVRLDAARLRGTEERLFLLMVGVGIDGAIVHALDRVRQGPIGYLSYLRPAVEALTGYSFHELEVEVDGKRVWRRGPGIVFVGNVPEYGTGFPILPLARSDDGLLDVCVLPAKSATDLIEHAVATLAQEHHLREGAVYVKGKRVVVRSKEPVAVQADGDPAGWTPIEIELLKTRVAFIVPP